jgi:hypothetical protein
VRLYGIVLPIPLTQSGFVDDAHTMVVDFGSTISVVPAILLIDMMVSYCFPPRVSRFVTPYPRNPLALHEYLSHDGELLFTAKGIH